jgi:hypothetical protein
MALLGILEAGRSITAPYAIGGEWTLDFDSAGTCASGAAKLRQPALSVSQSGTQALITLNDGRLTTIDATIEGATVSAKSLIATIGGKPGERTLEGTMNFDGCAPAHFRAVRQVARKRGE